MSFISVREIPTLPVDCRVVLRYLVSAGAISGASLDSGKHSIVAYHNGKVLRIYTHEDYPDIVDLYGKIRLDWF